VNALSFAGNISIPCKGFHYEVLSIYYAQNLATIAAV